MTGQVLCGINNIYTVKLEGGLQQCRIKGKILKEDKKSHSPLAAGDFVEVTDDPDSPRLSWITGRHPRKTALLRWNKKRRAPQVIAANVDLVVCVSSADDPPFRPRFIDRILVTCHYEEIKPLIIINKTDLMIPDEVKQRADNYRQLGYDVILCSAVSGKGLAELKAALRGHLAVFCGQSGVGKSSLLNRLDPGLDLRIGDLSAKYNRGSHTTCFAHLLTLASGERLIDTPGIRELYIYDLEPDQLRFHFIEFPAYALQCAFPACLHLDEPDCAVTQAVAAGKIHPDRYESYRRIYQHLEEMKKEIHE